MVVGILFICSGSWKYDFVNKVKERIIIMNNVGDFLCEFNIRVNDCILKVYFKLKKCGV